MQGISLKKITDTVGTDGTRLGDELQRIGYAGDLEPGSIVPHEYIELHIEQGPVLEAEGIQIGAVENLQGISPAGNHHQRHGKPCRHHADTATRSYDPAV